MRARESRSLALRFFCGLFRTEGGKLADADGGVCVGRTVAGFSDGGKHTEFHVAGGGFGEGEDLLAAEDPQNAVFDLTGA